jgi:hypothetical protein
MIKWSTKGRSRCANAKREKFFEEGKHVMEHTHNITFLNHLENQI